MKSRTKFTKRLTMTGGVQDSSNREITTTLRRVRDIIKAKRTAWKIKT